MSSMSASLKEKLANAKAKYAAGGITNFFKFKQGATRFRIVPLPGRDYADFYFDLGVHWIKADEDGKPIAVVGCNDIVNNEPCEVCAAIEKAALSKDDGILQLAKSWKARRTVLFAATILDGADASVDKVQIVEVSGGTFGDIANVLAEYTGEAEDENPLHLDYGIDLKITRTGNGKNDTRYTVMPAAGKSKPVSKAARDSIPDIPAVIKKEHFKGEEPKAIRAIGSITGSAVGALPGSGSRAMLTSTKPVNELGTPVEDPPFADDELPPKPKSRAAAPKVIEAEAEVVEDDPPPKPKAAKAAAPKAAPKAAATTAAATDEAIGDLNDDEMSRMLNELDSLD